MNKIEGFDSVLDSQVGDRSSQIKINDEQLMVIDDLGFSNETQEKQDKKSESDESIDPQDLEDAVEGMSIGTSQIAAVLTQKT